MTTLQGFPTAIELSGIFLFTREFAPIITLLPIFNSGKIVEFATIHTLLPIVIGFPFVCSLKLLALWLDEITETPGPNSIFEPKIIPLLAWI